MSKDEALFLDELKNEADEQSFETGWFSMRSISEHMSKRFPEAGSADQLEKALPPILLVMGFQNYDGDRWNDTRGGRWLE